MLVVVQARWTRPWCWWTSRPRGTAASASSPSRTRRRWTECARSTSTPSRTRRWHPHDPWRELLLTRLLLLQVECKKAQPKEVVQAANTAALLGKRVILSNLGLLPQLALGQGGAQSAAVAAAGHPAVAAVGAAGQQQPQLGHGAQLQAALQHQLAASAALGGYLLYIFSRSIWRLSVVWTFIHCSPRRFARCKCKYPDTRLTLVFAGSYGKLLGGAGAGPASMSGHRYSPYPLPSAAAGAGHQHGSQLGAAGAAAGAAAGGVQYTVASPLMSQLSAAPPAVLPTSAPSQQQQHLDAVTAAAGAGVPSHVAQTSQGRIPNLKSSTVSSDEYKEYI